MPTAMFTCQCGEVAEGSVYCVKCPEWMRKDVGGGTPCGNCGKQAPLRNGFCGACDYWRRRKGEPE